jgi:hypothetical protein
MTTYKQQLGLDGVTVAGVIRDGVAFVPADTASAEWREYLAWEAVPGQDVTPADPPLVKRSDAQAIVGSVQTTNATATELFRGPLVSGQGYIASVDVIGILNVSPFDTCVIRASVAAKRTPTATALIGAAVQLAKHADANAATWAAVASISGTDFVVAVTGQAGKVINWSLTGSFYRFAPGGLP